MMYEITIPPFQRALTNLSHILDKGAAHADTKKFDVNVWLNTRLVPDQLPMMKQIQIACDTAKLCTSRLSGKEAPVNDDKEQTWSEAKDRIQSTLAYLKTLTANDFKGAEEKRITTPRWEGKSLSGFEYATAHAIPNIYFHVATAYSILRSNGVDVGKKDFLGELPFKK